MERGIQQNVKRMKGKRGEEDGDRSEDGDGDRGLGCAEGAGSEYLQEIRKLQTLESLCLVATNSGFRQTKKGGLCGCACADRRHCLNASRG